MAGTGEAPVRTGHTVVQQGSLQAQDTHWIKRTQLHRQEVLHYIIRKRGVNGELMACRESLFLLWLHNLETPGRRRNGHWHKNRDPWSSEDYTPATLEHMETQARPSGVMRVLRLPLVFIIFVFTHIELDLWDASESQGLKEQPLLPGL